MPNSANPLVTSRWRGPIDQAATLACLLEVLAPKPGNVHRGADFADTTLADFCASAVAIGPAFTQARSQRVGTTILNALRATRGVTTANTNLGIVLLLAPLAAVPDDQPIATGISNVLSHLNADDAHNIYQAIREANPGGLQPAQQTIAADAIGDAPPEDVRTAMRQAAAWDLVAQQYTNDFHEVCRIVAPRLAERPSGRSLPDHIVYTHVWLMSEYPDSLIRRKCGPEVAHQAAGYASQVMRAGDPASAEYADALADLDFWCRSDGNRRNPGTTADLIAAGLFVCLREGWLALPLG